MARPTNYQKQIRDNSKYVPISDVVKKLNIKREALIYRLEKFQNDQNDIIVMYQYDDKTMFKYNGSKNPIYIDYELMERSVPVLQENETITKLIDDVEKHNEQIRVLYEVCYMKGFLRRVEE